MYISRGLEKSDIEIEMSDDERESLETLYEHFFSRPSPEPLTSFYVYEGRVDFRMGDGLWIMNVRDGEPPKYAKPPDTSEELKARYICKNWYQARRQY
jgi:hypothetical protein